MDEELDNYKWLEQGNGDANRQLDLLSGCSNQVQMDEAGGVSTSLLDPFKWNHIFC